MNTTLSIELFPEKEIPPPLHTLTALEAATRLDVGVVAGLSAEEARKRLTRFGPNRLRMPPLRIGERVLYNIFRMHTDASAC